MNYIVHVLAAVFFAIPAVFAQPSVELAAQVLSTPGTITHDGVVRNYRLYVPSGAGPFPVVFVLHGLSTTGIAMERYTRFSKLAAEEKFIVVYPDGIDKRWNDRSYRFGSTDDVGFIATLLDYIKAKNSVDASRVYVTGASNGGMLTHRLACDMGERFAAVAPVMADIPYLVQFHGNNAAPMPILMINGTADPLVPFGRTTAPQKKLNIVTARQTVDFWVSKNGCTSPPVITQLPDKDAEDGTRIERWKYAPGSAQAEVIFYAVKGGGHTWPGAPVRQTTLSGFFGNTSQDMDATKVIWKFFKQHARQQ